MEEENFLCNTEGFTQEKLFSSGFSPISLFASTRNLSRKITASKENDLEREKQIQQLNSTPKEERDH